MIWLLIAVLATLVALVLLFPFLDPRSARYSDGLGVFSGQLSELKRDEELGLISAEEARRSEVEIKRRLVRASEQLETVGEASPGLRRAAIAICTLTVAAAVGVYMQIGSPQLIGATPPERPQLTAEQANFLSEVDALASSLLENPDNAPGWAGLGRAYMAMGRYGDAAIAFNNAINLVPDSAALFSSLGEAYLFAEAGDFTPSSREAFQRALELDPNDIRARFFAAEAVYQSGDRATAESMWETLMQSLSETDPASEMIRARIDALPPVAASD